jgi:hypothetical protein
MVTPMSLSDISVEPLTFNVRGALSLSISPITVSIAIALSLIAPMID